MKLVAALLCALSFRAVAQAPALLPVDPVTHRIAYTGVNPAPGVKQNTLLTRAKRWCISRNADRVPAVVTTPGGVPRVVVTEAIGLPDAAGNAWEPLPGGAEWLVFTATLELSDGRFRYRLTDLAIEWAPVKDAAAVRRPAEMLLGPPLPPGPEADEWAELRRAFDDAVEQVLRSLQQEMVHPFSPLRHRL